MTIASGKLSNLGPNLMKKETRMLSNGLLLCWTGLMGCWTHRKFKGPGRLRQLEKLWERGAFVPVHKSELPKNGKVLGRTKTRLRGAILTAPSPKHAQNIVRAVAISPTAKSQVPSRKADLSKTELLNAERAARYRSAVGSGIYLSADRRDIAYSVKELARHMSAPRECDWECIEILAKYLQAKPDYVRVTALDADAYEGDLSLDVYSDSDWAGRPETRRSTDSHVAYVGGAIIAATTQTQPGLPATSSPDAESRGISRATREALFIHGLANEDFGLQTSIPWLWTDSSTALTATKRIGPCREQTPSP